MGTIPLSPEEQEDLNEVCAKRHVDFTTFSVVVEEEPMTAAGVSAIKRRVRVLHIPSGVAKDYEAEGLGSNWIAEFTQHLETGVFKTPKL
jgi:hypothetical protein